MNQKTFKNRLEFHAWLEENALSDEGIWVVFVKGKYTDVLKPDEALEEALCFGWIDGLIQRVDDKTYIKYFKQRKKNSTWSEKNRKLAEVLESRGIMTDFGRTKIKYAQSNGFWEQPKFELTGEQMQQFEQMLKPYSVAYENFIKISLSTRKAYASSYFSETKTEIGKQKRFDTIIERLKLNLNPMESMKKKL
ncbi:MAG: hypothetical protein LBE91_08625 [Tannerella sp.]|nr:hypothetical protein [Tannerella sp.]